MYKITLFDMNSAPVSDRIATFYTDDIDDFERCWVSLCKDDDDEERIERFRRSKAGECVTDYYTNLPVYDIVQEDPAAEILHEKPIELSDVIFCASNAYGWQKQYHVDNWYCVFRWIRFRKHFYRMIQAKPTAKSIPIIIPIGIVMPSQLQNICFKRSI